MMKASNQRAEVRGAPRIAGRVAIHPVCRWALVASSALACLLELRPAEAQQHPREELRVHPQGTPLVRVSRTSTPLPASAQRIADQIRTAEEVGKFGVQEGPLQETFGRIADTIIDDVGRVYVLDQSFVNVRVFDGAGRFLQEVGHAGSGPGEFVRPSSLAWDSQHDALYVADEARLIHVFTWSREGEHALLQFSHEIRLDVSPLDVCLLGAKIVTHAITFAGRDALAGAPREPTVLQVHSGDGIAEDSFGALYAAKVPLVNVQMSLGRLACDPVNSTIAITPADNLGETHIFDLAGTRALIVRYDPFRPMELLEISEPSPGTRLRPPPGGNDRLKEAVFLAPGWLLIQTVQVRVSEAGASEGDIDSYLISTKDRQGFFLGNDIPAIAAANASRFLVRRDAPNPEFVVLLSQSDSEERR